MEYRNLSEQKKQLILIDCEKVKRGEMTEKELDMKVWWLYGDDCMVPDYLYTVPNYHEYTPKEIKEMVLKESSVKPKSKGITKQERLKEKPPKIKKAITKKQTLNDLDNLLDNMLGDN